MKTLIHHITWESALPNIIKDGIVKLECTTLEAYVKSGNHIGRPDQQEKSMNWRLVKKQMKHTGRYVWFTEETNVNCIGTSEKFNQTKYAIPFYAEDIGAKKWSDVKKTIHNKKGKKINKQNDDCAIRLGDDISKWWVVDTEVLLSKMIGESVLRLTEIEV